MFRKILSDKLIELLEKQEEKQLKIEVVNPGLFELPEGEEITNLPIKHFKNLIRRKGWEKISRGLINLKIWNKKQNPSLAKWANTMHDKLSKWVEESREED